MIQPYSRKPMIQCGRIIRLLTDGVELCTLRRGHEGECLRPEFSKLQVETPEGGCLDNGGEEFISCRNKRGSIFSSVPQFR